MGKACYDSEKILYVSGQALDKSGLGPDESPLKGKI